MESLTSQGLPLAEVLKHKEAQNLRSRGTEEPSGNPDTPAIPPPPNMAVLSELADFNEMMKKT